MRLTARPYWGPVSVALVCLPALLFVAWYLGAGYTRFERYRRATKGKQVLTQELLQLFVHDELHRHLRRLSLPASPQHLPTIELAISAGGMTSLEEDVHGTGKRTYVKARLRKDGRTHKVRVRLQGRRHWHHIGVQKSFKVRANKGDLVDGLRTFNLVNDVTPFGLEEQIVLNVAKALGLLTPDYLPVRVRLNNTDLGVYRLVGTPDEGLLRRAGRMPGSIYSGRFDRACDPQAAQAEPEKPCGFAKLAGRDKEDRTRFDEILGLHQALHTATPKAWRDYAKARMDLDRFARFEALDVVFGGDQHDEGANLKLYYDPYRGRFEPIAMDFRAFRHDKKVNLVSNLLQRKLHSVPAYMLLRNQWIHRLATGKGAPAAVRARVDVWFRELRPELEADPYWDAYKLLPKATSFHRLMVRPMTVTRWLTASRKELDTHAQRHRYLRDVLDSPQLEARIETSTAGTFLNINVEGLSAYSLEGLGGQGEEDCGLPLNLPVVQANVQTEGDRAGPVPTQLRVQLPCAGPLDGLWLNAKNLVTGRSHHLRVTPGHESNSGRPLEPIVATGPAVVTLGPGVVQMPNDRHYEATTTVRILPGTTLRMGPGASLTFEGPVFAEGTARAPIRVIRAQTDKPFGGVRIFGRHTEGSTLHHVHFLGGSHAADPHRYVPGFLAIYDTAHIDLTHLKFSGIEAAEDVLHLTYVNDLSVDDVLVTKAPNDAIDLEMVQGNLRGLRVFQAGDECLDLMGAKIQVTDSVLLACTHNAISAGEDSEVTLDGLFIGRSEVGVLSKNASKVWISRAVIYEGEHALRTNKKDVHYQRPSLLEADTLFVHEVKDLKKQGSGTKISLLRSERGLPQEGQLRSLRADVLNIPSWQEHLVQGYVEEALR